jgi:hypothetical protein
LASLQVEEEVKMKSLLIAIVLVMVLSVPVMGDVDFDWTWNKQDINLQLILTGLRYIDWKQTQYIALNPVYYYETNPLLGFHPTLEEVNAYFEKCLILDYAGSLLLPKITITTQNNEKWIISLRFVRQSFVTLNSAYCVFNNFAIGIQPF